MGTKVGIGIGVAVGVLLFLVLAAFTFWYGRRPVTKKREEDGAVLSKVELGSGVPRRRELADTSVTLSVEEQGELERRRRAAELSGIAVSPVELSGQREELEILREKGRMPVEMD
jgi:hypothetical protein